MDSEDLVPMDELNYALNTTKTFETRAYAKLKFDLTSCCMAGTICFLSVLKLSADNFTSLATLIVLLYLV